ncbi:MAG TPA: DnaJ domain-containing protein [Gammaproteobacteria bacterium]|jgi:hypothetical protein|nr:DnaJ domain-containing protein [Gammaproteobacteria bacterium]
MTTSRTTRNSHFYQELGLIDGRVTPEKLAGITQVDISYAYKKRSTYVHPDKSKKAEAVAAEEFNNAKKAYDILFDPITRAAYDKALSDSQKKLRRYDIKDYEHYRDTYARLEGYLAPLAKILAVTYILFVPFLFIPFVFIKNIVWPIVLPVLQLLLIPLIVVSAILFPNIGMDIFVKWTIRKAKEGLKEPVMKNPAMKSDQEKIENIEEFIAKAEKYLQETSFLKKALGFYLVALATIIAIPILSSYQLVKAIVLAPIRVVTFIAEIIENMILKYNTIKEIGLKRTIYLTYLNATIEVARFLGITKPASKKESVEMEESSTAKLGSSVGSERSSGTPRPERSNSLTHSGSGSSSPVQPSPLRRLSFVGEQKNEVKQQTEPTGTTPRRPSLSSEGGGLSDID